jgi:hypothetical protein
MRTNVWTMPLAMPQPGTFCMTLIYAAALRVAAARYLSGFRRAAGSRTWLA